MKKITSFILLVISISINAANTIPFKYIDGKMVIEAKIENEKYNFIFDTGALTVLSTELEKKIKNKKTQIIFDAYDANNQRAKYDIYELDFLQLGNLEINKLNFIYSDTNWMTSRACMKIDGIIGANALNGKIWRIDFQKRIITILNETLEYQNLKPIVIPLSQEEFTQVPKISASIRGQKINFIFDTGSGMGFTITQRDYERIKDDNYLSFEGLLSQAINSVSKGIRIVDKMDVNIGSSTLSNQIIDTNPNATNLIGTKFLENYIVEIDFINKRILLFATDEIPKYFSFGVALAPFESNIIIINKLNIPELSEIKVSDSIIKLNEVDITKINNETFCTVKRIIENSDVLTIEDSNHKKFILKKENILKYLK